MIKFWTNTAVGQVSKFMLVLHLRLHYTTVSTALKDEGNKK